MCIPGPDRVGMVCLLLLTGMVAIVGALPQSDTIFTDTRLYEGDACKIPGPPARAGVCRRAAVCPQGIRSNGPRCEFSGNDPVLCCPEAHSTRDGPVGEITTRIAKQQCERIESRSAHLSDHLSGRRLEVALGEFPFMGLVKFEEDEGDTLRCGAALISKRFLVSAAHCFSSLKPVAVQLATITPDDPERDEYPVLQVHMHEGFRQRRNDIALLELTKDVKFDANVSPVCLNTDLTEIGPNVNLTVMGWGVDGDGLSTNKLLKATVNEIKTNECSNQYRQHKLGINIAADHLCALGELYNSQYTDACQGDSGGPLVTKIGQKFFLVGVVSTGPTCSINLPGVYTRITSHLDWIEQHVWAGQN